VLVSRKDHDAPRCSASWTMLETDFATWIRSGDPAHRPLRNRDRARSKSGHEWEMDIKLYTSDPRAYYHETSVNAFNLMALIGDCRQRIDDVRGVSGLHARDEPAGAAVRIRRLDIVEPGARRRG